MADHCHCHKPWEGTRYAHEPYPLFTTADIGRVTSTLPSHAGRHGIADGEVRCICGSTLHVSDPHGDETAVVCCAADRDVATV